MDNPGHRNLGSADLAAINAATAATVITSAPDASGTVVGYLDRLEGMLGATISANFTYGSSGGTSIKVIIETTINQGVTWIEVARLAFTTSSAEKVVNLVNAALATAHAPAALSDDATKDGILGDRFRAKILTVGTYVGNAALAVRMAAR